MRGGLILPPKTTSEWKDLIEKELKVVRDEPESPQKDLAIDQLESFYQLVLEAEKESIEIGVDLICKLLNLLS